MAEADAPSGSPFWRFSLKFYRQPGVADACIALQDGCGVDVNVLLFLLWLAAANRRLEAGAAAALCEEAHRWRDAAVAPLRALRRALKGGAALVDPANAEALRTRVKAVELEAERLEQEALFARAAGLPTTAAISREAAARDNVAAYARVLGHELAREPVEALLRAFAAE